jgi:hypothetical protein
MSDYCDINVSDALDDTKLSEADLIDATRILNETSKYPQIGFVQLCRLLSGKKAPNKPFCNRINTILNRLQELNLVCIWGRRGKFLMSGQVGFIGPGSSCFEPEGKVPTVIELSQMTEAYVPPPHWITRPKIRKDDPNYWAKWHILRAGGRP